MGLEPMAVAGAIALVALAWIRLPAVGVVCAALTISGAAAGSQRLEGTDAERGLAQAGYRVDGRAILLERPRSSTFGSYAELELTSGRGAGARLMGRADRGVPWPPGAAPGDELRLTGSVTRPRPDGDQIDLDWSAHLARTGVAGELELDRVTATGSSRGGLAGAIDALRNRAEGGLEEGLSPPQAALIRGMVLGQDERIDPLVREDFRASGLAHILAVSGQNVLLLSLLALPALAALGLGGRARLAALLALIALYVPLAGAGPSLQRAGVMGAAGIVALASGRAASRWYALLLAAAATLLANPRACGEPGWQLSFAAVTGILVAGPALRRRLAKLPRPLAEGIALTVAATVATGPLMLHHFERAPVASLPANLLALPAVTAAMWIGMVQIALGQAMVAGDPVAGLAQILAAIAGALNGVLLDYIGWIARRFAEQPWAELELGLGSPLAVGGVYVALAAAMLVARTLARRTGPRARELAGGIGTIGRGRRAALAALLTAAGLLLVVEASAPDAPPERLTVSFLDVGQGDATLILDPAGGSILIDGGPAEARVYRLVREAGVERLGLVVATHAAADHHGGLIELLRHVPVDLLLEGGGRNPDPGFRALLAEARARGVRTLPARAGQTLAVGGLEVEVIWPEPSTGPPPDDPNLRAVTTVVRAGDFDLLASGDAESPSLAPLELPDVDVFKVPHHGSADEGLPELLERLRPEIAAIGVGENGYGHPTAETLGALERSGAEVFRTDRDGTVEISVVGGKLAVETER